MSVEDLMLLIETGCLTTGYSKHKTMREMIRPGKQNLTILEYCGLTGDDYEHIYHFLRGKYPGYYPPEMKSKRGFEDE